MSYQRTFRRRIRVHYSGTEVATYPASKTGGSMNVAYSGEKYEDVDIEVNVDTSPFDLSIEHCNNNVTGLTASVGAMNAAQCAAITEHADKVSKAIIKGFFQSTKTDLGTQKAELEQVVQARLILLKQQAEMLKDKQKNMNEDYARTSSRYHKLFEDLNNELSIRIHQIDQPVFSLVKDVNMQNDRILHTDMIQTAVTVNKESSILQAQIGAAKVKRHAMEAMQQASSFLQAKAFSERTMKETCIEGQGENMRFVPVGYIQTESEGHQTAKHCYLPHYFESKNSQLKSTILDLLQHTDLASPNDNEKKNLQSYIQVEITKHIPGVDAHSTRVRNMINAIYNK